MRLQSPPIIYRYISREIGSPFWISLFVFTGVLFLARSLKLVDLVVNKNVPAADTILLFSLIIPRFLELAVPMSLLLGIILAFGRLSSDSELVVIRSAGVSLKKLAVPVSVFTFCALLATLLLTFWIRPWANYQLSLGLFEIARTQASAGLSAGAFNEIGNLTIYAERIDPQSEQLTNVLIGDRRNPELSRTFIAKHGKIVSDKASRTLSLQLYDGSMPEGSGLDFNVTYFEFNSISLPHSEVLDDQEVRAGKKSNELYIGELLATIRNMEEKAGDDPERLARVARYRTELHKRIVLPFSCFCIGFIAMALGIQPSRGGHTWGPAMNVGAGICLILTYYLMFAFANAISEQGVEPLWLIMWIPNIFFAVTGAFLFQKMGSERWMAVSQALVDGIIRVRRRIRIGAHAS